MGPELSKDPRLKIEQFGLFFLMEEKERVDLLLCQTKGEHSRLGPQELHLLQFGHLERVQLNPGQQMCLGERNSKE